MELYLHFPISFMSYASLIKKRDNFIVIVFQQNSAFNAMLKFAALCIRARHSILSQLSPVCIVANFLQEISN
jgi:hypothetical protein